MNGDAIERSAPAPARLPAGRVDGSPNRSRACSSARRAGKTVAAMGAMAAIGGETLILVPSRELATQWRDELVRHTSLTDDDIGEYHGGEKEIRAVTIATYRTAGMDRHRSLFDDREWGLIVYDEVHHVPSRIYRRSADLQAKHRLGLTATPTSEFDVEMDDRAHRPPTDGFGEAVWRYSAEPEVGSVACRGGTKPNSPSAVPRRATTADRPPPATPEKSTRYATRWPRTRPRRRCVHRTSTRVRLLVRPSMRR